MAEKLKQCPLCGSTDLKHYVTNARERNRGVIVCKGCGLRLEAYSDDEYKVAQAYQGDYKSAHEFTWEQARAAVADRWNRRSERTCRNASLDPECFKCSECGAEDYVDGGMVVWVDGGPQDASYCPHCGARVVEEADDDA